MDIFSLYIVMFFIIFLIMPITYFTIRFFLWLVLEYCGWSNTSRRNPERDRSCSDSSARRRASSWGLFYDRQGNIFTISDETANTGSNRYPDFFYLEPNGDDAARIRAQLEKDDKDLPSYDDVMRLTTSSTAPAPIPTPPTITGNVTNVVSASNLEPPPPSPEMTGPVPPYSEIDPNSSTNAISAANAASTSRGASVTIPIGNSSSNSSV